MEADLKTGPPIQGARPTQSPIEANGKGYSIPWQRTQDNETSKATEEDSHALDPVANLQAPW